MSERHHGLYGCPPWGACEGEPCAGKGHERGRKKKRGRDGERAGKDGSVFRKSGKRETKRGVSGDARDGEGFSRLGGECLDRLLQCCPPPPLRHEPTNHPP